MAACPAVSALPARLWRRPIVVSQRRIDANRRNAARSTGPRTESGKSRVARNPIKHGFFAGRARWTPQQHRDFIETYDGLRDDLRPQGIGEESCVWTMAHSYVRMAAVFRYESIAAYDHHQRRDRELDARIAGAGPAEAAQLRANRERLRRAGLWRPTLPGQRETNAIIRYMGSIDRSIRWATAELRGFQRLRCGGRYSSSKLRKQTHLVEENRAFSLMNIAVKARQDLLRTSGTARSAASSSSVMSAAPRTSDDTRESAKTNPLSSMFPGNRHARRRAAALARRRN